MAKEHKKLYKAGKNWLVATLFAVAAGTALATTSVHADTTEQNSTVIISEQVSQNNTAQDTISTNLSSTQDIKTTVQNTNENAASTNQVATTKMAVSAAQPNVVSAQNQYLPDVYVTPGYDDAVASYFKDMHSVDYNYLADLARQAGEKNGLTADGFWSENQNNFIHNAHDQNILIKDPKNLDNATREALNIYAAGVINQIRQKMPKSSEGLIYASPLSAELGRRVSANMDAQPEHQVNTQEHVEDATGQAAYDLGVRNIFPANKGNGVSEDIFNGNMTGTLSDGWPSSWVNSDGSVTLDHLKEFVYRAIITFVFHDGLAYGPGFHTSALLNTGDGLNNVKGEQYLSVTTTKANPADKTSVSLVFDFVGMGDMTPQNVKDNFARGAVTGLTNDNTGYQPDTPTTDNQQYTVKIDFINMQEEVIGTQTVTGKAGTRFNLNPPAGYMFDTSDESMYDNKIPNQDFHMSIVVYPVNNHTVDLSQNNGWLDSYSAQNGKLHLAGWHVSSASADYQYPYIIVLDNGREVGRAQAQLVDRPDVDRLYPNTNGRQAAGFIADVDIPTYAYGDRLTVIARFSNDPAGNGQYQDYYFNNLNPVTDLNANKANLDGYHLSTNTRNGNIQLNVAGWHAAGRSVTEGSHWLILFDNTTGSEIQRVKLSNADNYVVSRPDVARAFPGIANSGQSGFDGTFTLSRAELGHNLSVIARYSDDAVNGEGNRTDCWLAVPRLVNSQVNAGWVDNYHAERGTNGTGIDLVVSGWHVAGNSLTQPYHWVILYDNDTHQEVIRMPIKGQASDFYGNSHFATQPILRPDVARQYQNVLDSNRSGFEARFALLQSTSQHSLSIISRYSDDATNGEGNHTDYWMPAMRLDQGNHANLDNISLSGNQLHVSGWHATNQMGTDEHVIILYDATQHRELGRQTVGRLARPDVAKAFPTIYNAADSGFSAAFDFQPEMAHDQIQIISRWTSAGNENSDYVDYWFAPQLLVSDQSNRASLDAFNLSNGQLTATGWHASNQALGKQYHYVILFDQTTGHELSRVETPLVQRPDVARAFPTILNAGESGFNVNFAFDPAQLDGHRLAIVSRWTTDPAGNGNATDYWFAPRTFTAAQPTSRAVRGTGDGVGALDKWAVFINPALSSDNPNRIFFFTSGWHASNAAAGRPNHDFMLIDNTTGQQVGGVVYENQKLPARPISETSRPDIARLYGNQYQNAGESGFKVGLQTPQFTFGHRYTLISRYAAGEDGSDAVQQSYYLGQINQDMVNYGDGHDFFN